VWLVDLGMAGKTRPCVVISTAIADIDRAVITIVPHTTTLRGTGYEAPVSAFFLRPGAFNGQAVGTVGVTDAIRFLGVLKDDQMRQVERVVCKWLDLPCHR
jgi:mRNA interferase MazF